MRSTLLDFFKAGNDIHFRQSKATLFGIFAICAAITGALIVFGFNWVPNSLSEGLCWRFRMMAPLLGMVTMFALYFLVNSHAKGVTLTRTGVTDHRINSQEIPWRLIDAVSEGRHVSSRFVILRLVDTRVAPRTVLETLNCLALGLGRNERTISANGLKVSYETFVEAIYAGWRSAQQR